MWFTNVCRPCPNSFHLHPTSFCKHNFKANCVCFSSSIMSDSESDISVLSFDQDQTISTKNKGETDPARIKAAKDYIQKLVLDKTLGTIKFDTSRNSRFKSPVYQNFDSLVLNCEKDEFDNKGFKFDINLFLDEKEQPYYELDRYLACKQCLIVYVKGHGTSTLWKHSCMKKPLSNQTKITSHLARKKSDQLSTQIVNKIRDIETQFIVDGLRPFNITENVLFRQLIETVSDVSVTYGRLDAASVLHSTKSLTQDIQTKSDAVREDLKAKLAKVVGKERIK